MLPRIGRQNTDLLLSPVEELIRVHTIIPGRPSLCCARNSAPGMGTSNIEQGIMNFEVFHFDIRHSLLDIQYS